MRPFPGDGVGINGSGFIRASASDGVGVSYPPDVDPDKVGVDLGVGVLGSCFVLVRFLVVVGELSSTAPVPPSGTSAELFFGNRRASLCALAFSAVNLSSEPRYSTRPGCSSLGRRTRPDVRRPPEDEAPASIDVSASASASGFVSIETSSKCSRSVIVGVFGALGVVGGSDAFVIPRGVWGCGCACACARGAVGDGCRTGAHARVDSGVQTAGSDSGCGADKVEAGTGVSVPSSAVGTTGGGRDSTDLFFTTSFPVPVPVPVPVPAAVPVPVPIRAGAAAAAAAGREALPFIVSNFAPARAPPSASGSAPADDDRSVFSVSTLICTSCSTTCLSAIAWARFDALSGANVELWIGA